MEYKLRLNFIVAICEKTEKMNYKKNYLLGQTSLSGWQTFSPLKLTSVVPVGHLHPVPAPRLVSSTYPLRHSQVANPLSLS